MAKPRSQRASRRAGATFSKSSLSGFDGLYDTLKEFPRATQNSVLKRATRKALEPMVAEVRASAPVRSGKLQNSVQLVVGMDDPEFRARAAAAFKTKGTARGVKRTKGGGNVVARIKVGGRSAFHAPFVEFGTVKMAADPFLRPAFDGNEKRIIDSLRETMSVEVRKAAARRAKRLAKG